MTSTNLRITILGINYAPEPTGIAPYTTGLAEGLSALGHKVKVVTGYPHYPEWRLYRGYRGWKRRECVNGVDITRVRHTIPSKPNSANRLLMEVTFGARVAFAHWGRPDVVVLVSPALLSCGLAMARMKTALRRPASAIWVQDIYSRGIVETGTGDARTAWLMKKLESGILQSADRVVAIHNRFKQCIIKDLGVPNNRIDVVRNWTHLPALPPIDRSAVRQKMGWGEDEVVVLHAGNMGAKQGLENVVAAARIASAENHPLRFVLMGDGNQRPHLEVLGRGVDRLTFLKPLPDGEFQAAMRAADLLLVNEKPGVSDMAVPSKLTSYFSTGNPVIGATDAGSSTAYELEVSGGGIRINAGDPQALVEYAKILGSDRDRCISLGRNGLVYRNNVLSARAAIGHYESLLKDIVDRRSQVAPALAMKKAL